MPKSIITEIPCSHCGEMFLPSRHQRRAFRLGKNTYHTKTCWQGGTLLERFLANTCRLPNGCLEWTGYRNKDGYGAMMVSGRLRLAHHVAWFLHYDEWPTAGWETDHICHPNTCLLGRECPHRRCVEWSHLNLLVRHTGGNNSAERSNAGRFLTETNPDRNRARAAAMTTCKRGHPRTAENTYTTPVTGMKNCRVCKRLYMREYRREKKSVDNSQVV